MCSDINDPALDGGELVTGRQREGLRQKDSSDYRLLCGEVYKKVEHEFN